MRISSRVVPFRSLFVRVALGAIFLLILSAWPLSAQEARKVVSRVAPAYPEMARRMHVAGAVRVDATVSADGHVEKARATSGHPLLAAAAQDAVTRWKFAPGSDTSVVSVEVVFQGAQ
jgi:TonB family protein